MKWILKVIDFEVSPEQIGYCLSVCLGIPFMYMVFHTIIWLAMGGNYWSDIPVVVLCAIVLLPLAAALLYAVLVGILVVSLSAYDTFLAVIRVLER